MFDNQKNTMQVFNFSDLIINKKYKISHQINKGSFGLIFKAKDLECDHDVAVKIEPFLISKKYLVKEARILNLLQKNHHVPRFYWCGCKPNSTFLVMELLGKNLEDLFKECNKKFTLKTVLMMADQMISSLEFIHSKGYLHRDINPRNICVGLAEKASNFYSIDFGLSSTYRELNDNDKLKENFPFTGTLNFASVNTHKGYEQTCLDDLESLFYVIIYFLTGKLPWESISNEKGDLNKKLEEIKKEKINTTIEDLCADMPEELKECLEYIKKSEFYVKPDYKFLKKKCEKLYMKKYGVYDYQYDWTNNELKEKETSVFIENKEKIGQRHNKKYKCRLNKDENENLNMNVLDIDAKYEEEKICEPKMKKNEEENSRRKNSFAKIVPDQIYHIKKKIKTENTVNLIEKSSPLKKIEKDAKTSEKEKIIKLETKNDEEKKSVEIQQTTKQEKDEKEIAEEDKFSEEKKDQEKKNPEIQENEELKTTIKEKFDLLFGKNEENNSKNKIPDEKGYCKIF